MQKAHEVQPNEVMEVTGSKEAAVAQTIRLQVVSDGIPGYQNDFNDKGDAQSAAERFALGAKAVKVDLQAGDLFRYQSKNTTIRAFYLGAAQA